MSGEGLVHLYTGDGKGKTTAAVGLAVRAAGAGMRVLFAQFLKGRPTAELEPLSKLGVTVLRCAAVIKFIPYMNEQELLECRRGQQEVLEAVKNGAIDYDMIILDEVCGAISTGMVSAHDITELIKGRPQKQEFVMTGRGAPAELAALADYVSDIQAVKHPYDSGISARRGIEF